METKGKMEEILKISKELLGEGRFESFSGELFLRMDRILGQIEEGAPAEAVILKEFRIFVTKERCITNRAKNRPHRWTRTCGDFSKMMGEVVRKW